MRAATILLLAFVLGAGAGVALLQDMPGAQTSLAARESRPWEDSARLIEGSGSRSSTLNPAERLVNAMARAGNEIERDNEIYLALEVFDAGAFHHLFASRDALKTFAEALRSIDWQTRDSLASGLVARWLMVEPDMVKKWGLHVLDVIEAIDTMRDPFIGALAEKRPEEMLSLASSRKNSKERAEIISRALRELAAHDAAKARTWLSNLSDPVDRGIAEKALRMGMAQADPLHAIDLARTIESRNDAYDVLSVAAENAAKMGTGVLRQLVTTPMSAWMLSVVVGSFAQRDPESAVELAIKAGADPMNHDYALQVAFAALASRDPAKAIANLDRLKGAERTAAIAAIGPAWASREPAKALAWLVEQPLADRRSGSRWSYGSNDALLIAFNDWAEGSQSAARAWVDSLPAGSTRTLVQNAFADVLAHRGETAEAARVVAELGDAADARVVGNLATAWARRDPEAAADWAMSQKPGPAQNRALAAVVGAWGDENPSLVKEWLAQFPPSEARDRSVLAFLGRGTSWTTGSDVRSAEFNEWFGLIDDPWYRAQAARVSFWRISERDPAAARAWIETLPNVDRELVRNVIRDAGF